MKKNYIFYINPHNNPLTHFLNTNLLFQYNKCNMISYSKNITYALCNSNSKNSLLLTWIPNENNFYDDNKEILYLKSEPLIYIYYTPINDQLKSIVINNNVIQCITFYNEIFSWGFDLNSVGLLGNNEEVFSIEDPEKNINLTNLKINEIKSGLRHFIGIDIYNTLYTWGYYLGNNPIIIDYDINYYCGGNDRTYYIKNSEKNILYIYSNKNKSKINLILEKEIKKIFIGSDIIVLLMEENNDINIINSENIYKLNYLYENNYKINDISVRYNEIYILLDNIINNSQLLLKYSTHNKFGNFDMNNYYERIFKINRNNLKKKISMIDYTTNSFSNGIFFDIELENKEKNYYEKNKDKLFVLISRIKKNKNSICFIKINNIEDESVKNDLKNMGKIVIDNYCLKKNKNYFKDFNNRIKEINTRNKNIDQEEFFKRFKSISNDLVDKVNLYNNQSTFDKFRTISNNLENETIEVYNRSKRNKEIFKNLLNLPDKYRNEKKEKERLEKERKERLERERKEREKKEKEELEMIENLVRKEREDKEREDKEREEKEKKEKERIEREEKERIEKEEKERIEREEKERKEREENERIEREENERKEREEKERKEREELERIRKEKEEEEKRLKKEKELERIRKEKEKKEEEERKIKEKELERLRKEKEKKEEEERKEIER